MKKLLKEFYIKLFLLLLVIPVKLLSFIFRHLVKVKGFDPDKLTKELYYEGLKNRIEDSFPKLPIIKSETESLEKLLKNRRPGEPIKSSNGGEDKKLKVANILNDENVKRAFKELNEMNAELEKLTKNRQTSEQIRPSNHKDFESKVVNTIDKENVQKTFEKLNITNNDLEEFIDNNSSYLTEEWVDHLGDLKDFEIKVHPSIEVASDSALATKEKIDATVGSPKTHKEDKITLKPKRKKKSTNKK